jgi:tetratricopeptide (TPR) repeat protein
MEWDDKNSALNKEAWKHISAGEYEQAEEALRRLLELADSGDAHRMFYLYGLLASVLNSLQRFGEATGMLRQQLSEAKKITTSNAAVDAARYFLSNQFLLYGTPEQALAEANPVPGGVGHTQCLLHSVTAQALWKLSRHEEAVFAARHASEAAPTEDRRSELSVELAAILGAG